MKKQTIIKTRRRRRRHFTPFFYLSLFILIVFIAGSIYAIIHVSSSGSDPNESTSEALSPKTNMTSEMISRLEAMSNSSSESSVSNPVSDSQVSVPVQPDNSKFDHALFIGDSRTQGFQMYSGLTNATFYAGKGLNVETVFTKPVVNTESGTVTVAEALNGPQFEKVFIMLGINELGWPNVNTFIEYYGKVIDTIKASQPNATVYVQSIIHVTQQRSDSDSVYNNAKVNQFNQLIQQMAAEKGCVYLDLNEVLSDENGALFADAATDGIHLTKPYCIKWLDYLRSHI